MRRRTSTQILANPHHGVGARTGIEHAAGAYASRAATWRGGARPLLRTASMATVLIGTGLALAACTSAPASGHDSAQAYVDAYYAATMVGGPDFATEQQDIATCMKERGFDYVPWDPQNDCRTGPALDPNMSADEFRSIYGYGITPLPGEPNAPGSQQCVDPNYPTEQAAIEAYWDAMHGTCDNPEGCPRTPENMGEDPGCVLLASWKNIPPRSAQALAFDDLAHGLSDAKDEVENSATVRPVVDQWQECMTEAGYPEVTEGDGQQYLGDDGYLGYEEYTPQSAQQLVSDLTLGMFDAYPGNAEVPLEVTTRAHSIEMDVAAADDRCQAEVGYQGAYQAALAKVDSDYLAEHRAEFESMALYTAEHDKAKTDATAGSSPAK